MSEKGIANEKDQAQTGDSPSEGSPRNLKLFALGVIVFEIVMIVMFGIFVRPQAHLSNVIDNGLGPATGAGLLVVIGFGLLFSYLREYSWSGIGFTLLITALSLQYYVLISGFWSKAEVQVSNTNWSQTHIDFYVSDEYTIVDDSLGNTLVGGFKCALAMNIIFAATGGRAGPLEGLIIVVLGTITYELNRQTLTLFSVDHGGSMTVFEFGGVAGSVISILMTRFTQSAIVSFNRSYTSNKPHVTLTMLGVAFVWVYLPLVNMDIRIDLFIYSNAGISAIFCICASLATVVGLVLVLEGKLNYRDVITAPIAGGVIVGSSSTYIYNPLESLMLGILAGVVQVIMNRLEQKTAAKPYWGNGVLSLFAIQGFLGGLFSAVMRAIHRTAETWGTAYDSLPGDFVYDQGGQISGTFVTLGIAAGTGLVLFLIITLVNQETSSSLYQDSAYWIMNDQGISAISKEDDRKTEPDAGPEVEMSQPENKQQGAEYL